ncbi:MAG TPA: DASS family sodium-coupled anion symporter [Bacteroidetes bacterium]|nr:DASS family sodium-coupled anion symporter [Bacteroidota bacterium]
MTAKHGGEVRSYTRWQFLGLILGIPVFFLILFLPTPAGMTPAAQRTAAVASLMVVWWITEAIPIPATALIPLALFPMLKVLSPAEVSASYGDKNIFLFMGGFLMAVTMERWELHRRIALNIIRMIGMSPRRVILGFMVATAFLSMWISNTATTMMMLPIGLAIVYQFDHLLGADKTEEWDFKQALMLSIAFSASIGGIGTLVGTPPNIIFVAALKKIFPAAPEITFVKWFLVCFPIVVVFLPIAWVYMTRIAFKIPSGQVAVGGEVISEELQKLGPMKKEEKWTLFYFILLALAWTFRKNLNFGFVHIPGWSNLLGIEKNIHDSTVAIFVSMLLFLIPVDLSRGQFLLDWKSALRIPWGILILFGGGIALAAAFGETGLAHWIARSLTAIQHFPLIVMLFFVSLLMVLLTEVTSNTAITTIFMPILAATAVAMKVNPIGMMMVGTISASLAFMLPVATPPNAIVFGSGFVRLPTMARVGFGLDVIGIALVILAMYLLAGPVFGIHFTQLPLWAQ